MTKGTPANSARKNAERLPPLWVVEFEMNYPDNAPIIRSIRPYTREAMADFIYSPITCRTIRGIDEMAVYAEFMRTWGNEGIPK